MFHWVSGPCNTPHFAAGVVRDETGLQVRQLVSSASVCFRRGCYSWVFGSNGMHGRRACAFVVGSIRGLLGPTAYTSAERVYAMYEKPASQNPACISKGN